MRVGGRGRSDFFQSRWVGAGSTSGHGYSVSVIQTNRKQLLIVRSFILQVSPIKKPSGAPARRSWQAFTVRSSPRLPNPSTKDSSEDKQPCRREPLNWALVRVSCEPYEKDHHREPEQLRSRASNACRSGPVALEHPAELGTSANAMRAPTTPSAKVAATPIESTQADVDAAIRSRDASSDHRRSHAQSLLGCSTVVGMKVGMLGHPNIHAGLPNRV